MVRILITYILPLALPTVLYFAWAAWARKKIAAKRAQHAASGDTEDHSGEQLEDYDIKTPWFRLILAGVVLLAVGLMLSVFFGPENPPESVYQPPHMDNGKIVPGQYVPKPN